ncbi:hypothetical protein BD626DRAFT_493712 [Schizophyllum amplum]|uniref:Uncharacterized protein n=1 Tax=Schizophyllum amplum TaxID=97359 RepID=A0A550CH02_9AGAR|nr:hypothetical protein BD626DRAFT_493712 [Auriculariopsis ampla]
MPCFEAILACSCTLRKLIVSADKAGPLPANRGPTTATSLCLYIQAPHLQTATLSSFPDLEIDALPIFQEFLQNSSGCPLSHTEDTEIGDDSLISPEVADALSRNGCALTPDGGTRRTTTLLPNLLRLTFDVGGTPYEEENEDYRDALRDIVVSRTRSRVVHGVALARLERFSTDAIGDSSYTASRNLKRQFLSRAKQPGTHLDLWTTEGSSQIYGTFIFAFELSDAVTSIRCMAYVLPTVL